MGTTLAGYTLRELIGEGGTSTVVRAEHPEHGVCAVKVRREKLSDDKTAITRFVREAKYGTRVTHPNVVRTIEVGEARPGLHFLAIEWASGELLERIEVTPHAEPHAQRGDAIVEPWLTDQWYVDAATLAKPGFG